MKQYFTIDKQGRTVMPCSITKQWEVDALERVADQNGYIPFDEYYIVMTFIQNTRETKRKQN